MPVLDRSALEDASGMDFLKAALGEPCPAAPAGARPRAALSPDGRSIGGRAGTLTRHRIQSAAAPRFPIHARLGASLP